MPTLNNRQSNPMERRAIAKTILRLLVCIVAALAVTVVLYVVSFRDRPFTAALFFLFLVLIVSAVWGLRYAIFVSFLAALGVSWSAPPLGRFEINDPRDIFALIAFLFTGTLTSYLSDRARKEAAHANQRRAEAVAAQQRFADLVNSVEGIVWEAEAETFAFSFVSDQAERILGYPKERWVTEPTFWKDHLHPEDREPAVEFCRRAAAEKRSHDFEYRMIAHDGRVVWLRDLVTVVVENDRATLLLGVMVDVTNRREREQAIREQANLLGLTHDAIFVRDMNSVIKYWNRGAEELYGWTAEEALGRVSHELLKSVFRVSLQQMEEALLHSGRWEGELVHTKKFGTPVMVASRWSLQRDEKGVPVAILETNNDITERKRAEQARKEIEEQWRAAFESNPTMYFILDEAGTILTVNSFGAEQLGYTVEELTGHPVLNVFVETDKEAIQKHARECFEHSERMMRWEACKLRKNGTMLWVRETAKAVFLKNRPVLLVVCEDITEQKRAEEAARRSERELREVVETIPAMVWAATPDGSNAFVNKRWQVYTGLSAEQTAGSGWLPAVHPDDVQAYVDKWQESASRGVPFEHEARFRNAAEGEYRWFLSHGVPLRDEQGNIVKWFGIVTDITERKRGEEAVRRSEKELQQVVATIPAWVFVARPDGFMELNSPGWLEYSGISAEQSSPGGWIAAIHPDDVDVYVNKWQESLSSGKPFENEARHRSKNGEYRWFLIRVVPLRDEQENILKWYGTVTDIEDRKRAEALLIGEKRILEMVATGEPLAEILDGLCRLAEEQAPGVLASVLLLDGNCLRHGAAPSLPAAYTDAIDGVAIGPCVGSCGTAAYSGKQVIVEDIATDPRWADYRAAALPHSLRACWSTPIFSSAVKVIATFAMYYRQPRRPSSRDQEIIEQITHLAGVAIERKLTYDELQRSQTYLAEAQRLTHTGSWALRTSSNTISYWSEENFRVWDFDPQQGLPTSEMVWDRIHPDDLGRMREAWERAQRERTDYSDEYRIVLPEGSIRHIYLLSHPICNTSGEIVEHVGTHVDVTERKCAEQERERFRQVEADLAHVNRVSMMGELTASLAHEIRQPIAAAITSADACLRWLTRNPPDLERARAAAMRIENDGTRAAEVINRLRSFYKKGAPAEPELVDVNEVAREMLVLLRSEANRYSIPMRTDLAAELPKVTADRVQLQQVFLNLMLNGIEAMKDLGGELAVKSQLGNDGQVQISVSDTGVGLPLGKVDQIFDAFFTTKRQGSGMGLAISRSIVESHGGRLWASGNTGRGATFHFTLPSDTERVKVPATRT